jgi:hypothetical protein
MMQAEQFREYFEENMPSYLALLRQMVRINSFTVNPAGVNKLGEVTAVAFEELGFESETIQSDKPHYGKHVVLTRYGKSGRQIGWYLIWTRCFHQMRSDVTILPGAKRGSVFMGQER